MISVKKEKELTKTQEMRVDKIVQEFQTKLKKDFDIDSFVQLFF